MSVNTNKKRRSNYSSSNNLSSSASRQLSSSAVPTVGYKLMDAIYNEFRSVGDYGALGKNLMFLNTKITDLQDEAGIISSYHFPTHYAADYTGPGTPYRVTSPYFSKTLGQEVAGTTEVYLNNNWYNLTKSFAAEIGAAGYPLQDITEVNLDKFGLGYGGTFDINNILYHLGFGFNSNFGNQPVNPYAPGGAFTRSSHHGGGGGGHTPHTQYEPTYPTNSGNLPAVAGTTIPEQYWSQWSIGRTASTGNLINDLRAKNALARSEYRETTQDLALQQLILRGLPTETNYQPQNIIDQLSMPTAIGGLMGGYTPGYPTTPEWVIGASEYRSMNFISATVGANAGGLAPSFLAGAAEWAYRGGMLGQNPSDRFQFANQQSYYAGKAAQSSGYWQQYYQAESSAYGAMGGLAQGEVGWFGAQASSYLWADKALGADVRLYGWIGAGAIQQLSIGGATRQYMRTMYQWNPQGTEDLLMQQGPLGYGASPSYLGYAYGYPSPIGGMSSNLGQWGLGYGAIETFTRNSGMAGVKASIAISSLLAGVSLLAQTGVVAYNRYQAGMPVVPTDPAGAGTLYQDIAIGSAETAIGAYLSFGRGWGKFGAGGGGADFVFQEEAWSMVKAGPGTLSSRAANLAMDSPEATLGYRLTQTDTEAVYFAREGTIGPAVGNVAATLNDQEIAGYKYALEGMGTEGEFPTGFGGISPYTARNLAGPGGGGGTGTGLGGIIAGVLAFTGMETLRPFAVNMIEQTSGRSSDVSNAVYTAGYELPTVYGAQVLAGPLIQKGLGVVAKALLPESALSFLGGLAPFAGLAISGAVAIAVEAQAVSTQRTFFEAGLYAPETWGGVTNQKTQNFMQQHPAGIYAFGQLVQPWGQTPGTPSMDMSYIPYQGGPTFNIDINKAPSQTQINAMNAAYLQNPYTQAFEAEKKTYEQNYNTYLNQKFASSAFSVGMEFISPMAKSVLLSEAYDNPAMISGAVASQKAWIQSSYLEQLGYNYDQISRLTYASQTGNYTNINLGGMFSNMPQAMIDLNNASPQALVNVENANSPIKGAYSISGLPTPADFMLGQIDTAVAKDIGVFDTPGIQLLLAATEKTMITTTTWTAGPPVISPALYAGEYPQNPSYLMGGKPGGYTTTSTRSTQSSISGFQQYAEYFSSFSQGSGGAYYGYNSLASESIGHPVIDWSSNPMVGHTPKGQPIYASESFAISGGTPGSYFNIPSTGNTWYGGPPPAAPTNYPTGFSYNYSGMLTYYGQTLSPSGVPELVPSFATPSGALSPYATANPYSLVMMGGQYPPVMGINIPGQFTPTGQNMVVKFLGLEGIVELPGKPPIDLTVRGGQYKYAPTGPLTAADIQALADAGVDVRGMVPGQGYAPGTTFAYTGPSQFEGLVPGNLGGPTFASTGDYAGLSVSQLEARGFVGAGSGMMSKSGLGTMNGVGVAWDASRGVWLSAAEWKQIYGTDNPNIPKGSTLPGGGTGYHPTTPGSTNGLGQIWDGQKWVAPGEYHPNPHLVVPTNPVNPNRFANVRTPADPSTTGGTTDHVGGVGWGGKFQQGYEGVISKPTAMHVSEYGQPEYVKISPMVPAVHTPSAGLPESMNPGSSGSHQSGFTGSSLNTYVDAAPYRSTHFGRDSQANAPSIEMMVNKVIIEAINKQVIMPNPIHWNYNTSNQATDAIWNPLSLKRYDNSSR